MACCLAPEGDLSRIPAAYQKIQDRTKTWISRDQTVYVETEGHRQAVRQLDQRGAVVITGPEGSGKSALGHALLRHYWRHHAHTPLDVRDHEEWCQHVDVKKGRQVVLLDDVFGSEEFSYTSYKTRARDLFHMQDSAGEVEQLSTLIKNQHCADSTDKKGNTALLIACKYGHLEAVKELIDLGANVWTENDKYWSSLHMAASNGDFDIVRFLLDSGLCAEGTDWTPVHVACSKGHGQLIPVMVHEETDLEPTDEGTTALYMACVSRNEKAVRYLLRRGVTADVRDDGGWTPLHEACCSGEEEIMRMLLKKGASVDAVNQRGLTPFHVACEYDQIDILDLLLHVDGGAATDTRSVKVSLLSAIRLFHSASNCSFWDTVNQFFQSPTSPG
nr:hypothetical protein BaRGS_011907 [Batillaria attramentaria]